MTSDHYSQLQYDLLRKAYGLDAGNARLRKAETASAFLFAFAFALATASFFLFALSVVFL